MKRIFFILLLPLIAFNVVGQDKPAYTIFDAKGKKVSYNKMLKSITDKDIVLFGETHNNPISHWLQLEVTSDLHKSRQLILGAEMIEADNQNELNDYLKGEIDYKELDSVARLWPNYKTDYAPLVNFAKDNELTFVATNIPRRYANMVYKIEIESPDSLKTDTDDTLTMNAEESIIIKIPDSLKIGDHDTLTIDAEESTIVKIPDSLKTGGHDTLTIEAEDSTIIKIPDSLTFKILDSLRFVTLDSLSNEEKEWMAPLPMPFDHKLATYQSILQMEGGHGTAQLVLSQATKDATMAHFILANYKNDHLFIHYNGSFHSDSYEGILWFMKRERQDLTYSTITTVSQENLDKLEVDNQGKADFIICVDNNMTTTY